MLVHFYDSEQHRFLMLPVYGFVSYDYKAFVLVYDSDKACFYLKNELEEGRRIVDFVHVDVTGWIKATEAVCESLADFCTQAPPAPTRPWIAGYPEMVTDAHLLRRLMSGESVPLSDTQVTLREIPGGDEWYEIKTQAEADLFANALFYPHDAHIDSVTYIEPKYDPYTVSVILDMTMWFGCRMEYRFASPTVVHITNGRDSNGRDILDACLFVDENGVFWADEDLEKEEIDKPFDPEITYIRAKAVKVRRVD